jgi:hypothetical protein
LDLCFPDRKRARKAEKVEAGELSAHAAAVEAGFRKPVLQVPTDPGKLADKLVRHFWPVLLVVPTSAPPPGARLLPELPSEPPPSPSQFGVVIDLPTADSNFP